MAINPSSFSGVSIETAGRAYIEIFPTPPTLGVLLDPPLEPGRMIGYWNPANDKVELYVVGGGGTYWLRVG